MKINTVARTKLSVYRFHLAFLFTPHPTEDDSLRIFYFLLSFTAQVANFFPLISHPEWPTRFLPFAQLYIVETWSVNLGQSELELQECMGEQQTQVGGSVSAEHCAHD